MTCPGCGREVTGIDAANQPVSADFKTAIQDRLRAGGACPICGSTKAAAAPTMKNYRAKVILGGLLMATIVRYAALYYQSPLRTVPEAEAVRRATADPRVRGELGEPIHRGHTLRDKIYHDETGWSEAKLTIPLEGSRRKGTLKMVAGKGFGDWIFSTLEVRVENEAAAIDLLGGKLELAKAPDYQSIHQEKPAQAELLDAPAERPDWDGTYPVFVIEPQVTAGGTVQYNHRFGSEGLTLHNSPVNEFEVSVGNGMFVLRQTDLLVDDTVPLALTRTYRPGDPTSHAFGYGANHPYDIAPEGTRNPYTYMEIHLEDGDRAHFDRISRGTGYADAVYEHRQSSSEFYKARIWWNGNGWTLRFTDGRLILFPESYNATNMAQGAPIEMRDAAGRSVRLQRDPDRNLRLLVSPNGHFIRFEYDDLRRITEATDDRGRTVRYSYDAPGRLISMIGAEGRETRFTYEEDRLLTVQDGSGRVELRNRYEDGVIAEQDLADGSVFRFAYQFANSRVVKTVVTAPGGTKTVFEFEKDGWRQIGK